MIKVRSKTLFISGEEQSIAAVGEAETTAREFSIDRLSGDGIDLANLIFKLNIRYVGTKQSDRSDLEKIVTDDSIILRWLVSSVTLSHPGTAFIQLDAFDREGSCRWKSYQAAVYIEKSLDSVVVSRSTLSELEQLEKKFETIGVGEAARVEAEKKRIVAEEKREEAEEKRNQSLANIVSEEEKIKAVSEEAKGYRDSIKEDKEAVSRDRKDVVSVRSEVISAVNTAQQYASLAEVSKTSAISEGNKIKEATIAIKNEATTARNEAVNAKAEANRAKDEAVYAKNEANNAAARAKQNADRAETFANNAKVSEGKAEGFKTEANVSAQKAKDSEAKTLEALKKAEASGKVSITKEEMKTYVDSVVGNVKSGITEAEATTLARKVANESITSRFADGKGTIESDVRKWSQDPFADLSIDATSVIPGYFFKNALSGFKTGMFDIYGKGQLELRNVEKSLYSTQRDLLTFLNRGNALETFKEIKSLVKRNQHDRLKVGDYIVDNNIKWIVASIDRLGEKRSVEFITFDFPDTLSIDLETSKNKVFHLKDFDIEISKICNNIEATSRLAREGIPSKTILYYKEDTYETMYYAPEYESVDSLIALGGMIIASLMTGEKGEVPFGATAIPLFDLEIFKRKLYASGYLVRELAVGRLHATKGDIPKLDDFDSKAPSDKRSKLPKPIICFRIEGN